MIILSALKVLLPTLFSFIIGILITPALTSLMYKYRMWKRKSRSAENTDAMSLDFQKIHNHQAEGNTPRVGGVVMWLSVFITMIFAYITQDWIALFIGADHAITHAIIDRLSFLSLNQTALLVIAFFAGSLFGLVDDMLQIYGKDMHMSDGIPRKLRIMFVVSVACVGAWWFYSKLGMDSIHVPFYGDVYLGFGFVFLFLLAVLGVFSGGVIDGIDGLAAGVMISAFASYTLIAFSQTQYDLAAFGGTIIGGLLAFLWFNVPPARFYLGETGMLGLTIVLAMFAFLTKEVVALLIIAFPLVATSVSSSVQMFSKKYFHKKVFRIAPLHHHFQAIGWSSAKVTMRYWIVSVICGVVGVIVALLG
jgi:phospho-N-acetylmuramoyl-pentapeptide-transferase